MKKLNKKGFTIVELVIVIGVIGILSAILIPTFVNLTSQAKEKQIQSNLRNAYAAYVADAADGEKDDDKDVKFASVIEQSKIALTESETAPSASESSTYYFYDDANNRWTYELGKKTGFTSATHVAKKGENNEAVQYGGYYIWQLVA